MARALRVEYPGAIYHVSGRMVGSGRNERLRLFRDGKDFQRFQIYWFDLIDPKKLLRVDAFSGWGGRRLQGLTVSFLISKPGAFGLPSNSALVLTPVEITIFQELHA